MNDFLADYSARYLEQYAAGGFETVIVAIRRDQVLSFLHATSPRRVIEMGCGLEPLFLFSNNFDQWTIVEPSPEFAAAARQRAAGDPRIDIRKGYGEDLALEPATVPPDAIIVSSLLHEVPEPERLLAAVRSLCGPHTFVHFNVPNVRSFHRLLALEMGLIADLFEESEMETRFHRHTRYDRETFEAALRGGGFIVVEFGTYFVKPFTHRQMDALLASKAFDRRIIEGLARMTKYLPEMGCEMFANVRRA